MYKYTDAALWIMGAIVVLLMLAAYQSSEADKASCQRIQSNNICEYYIR